MRNSSETYCQELFMCCLCAWLVSNERWQLLHTHERRWSGWRSWGASLKVLSVAVNGVCATVEAIRNSKNSNAFSHFRINCVILSVGMTVKFYSWLISKCTADCSATIRLSAKWLTFYHSKAPGISQKVLNVWAENLIIEHSLSHIILQRPANQSIRVSWWLNQRMWG